MSVGPTKILVVDDSALYRQSIHNVLRDVQDVRIVGVARNGVEALDKIEAMDPDLLTLDVQMPDMDGIQLLRELNRRRLRAKAIMVSSYTSDGAQVTTEALMEGAFDFILKPSSGDWETNRQQLRDSLSEKISAFRESSGAVVNRSGLAAPERAVRTGWISEAAPRARSACQAVVIGTSTGGPSALKLVLPKLPADLTVPVIVVQHMPAHYTASLAKRLDDISPLEVVEAEDGAEAIPGRIMIAPGGQQTRFERVIRDRCIQLRVSADPPDNGVRPSVDYLIRSACEVLDGNVLAVIMTGMGRDGVKSCQQLKEAGGYVFAQNQEDCVVYGMPKAVIQAGLADRILPLGKIAPAIVRHIKRSSRG